MSHIINVLKGKCPNCQKGDIFHSNGNVFLFRIPKMNARCGNCNFKFEKETGFFFGAMYVSYALACAEMIAVLVLGWYFVGLTPLNVFIIIVVIIILTSTINFTLARIIWIYLFYKKE